MSFDPNIPVNGTVNDATPIRANFNVLNARADALAAQDITTNQRIDTTDANVTSAHQRIDQNDANDAATNARCDNLDNAVAATNARIDNLPPAFPHTGDAEINGNLKTANGYIQGELGLGMSDIGGSGESGLKITASNNGAGYIPRFTGRNGGTDQSNFGIDGTGIIAGNGTPTVQPDAILKWDGMDLCYKPWNVTVETIYYMDHNGNPQTKQVLVPPP